MKKCILFLIVMILLFSGCKNKSSEIIKVNETKEVIENDYFIEKEGPVNSELKLTNILPATTEYDGSFIVVEYDEYYTNHSFLADYTLPDRVIDSICILAAEYFEKHGEVTNCLENLCAEEFKNPKTYLKYALDLQKESDKMAFITISYGIDEKKNYTVIYERKAQHVFSVYCDGKMEYTIYRDGNSVHTEYVRRE